MAHLDTKLRLNEEQLKQLHGTAAKLSVPAGGSAYGWSVPGRLVRKVDRESLTEEQRVDLDKIAEDNGVWRRDNDDERTERR